MAYPRAHPRVVASAVGLFVPMAVLLGTLVACGGSGDDGPTVTPDNGVTGPADVVAIFGGPEMARALLAAGKDAPGIEMFLLSSASAGDWQFDAKTLPSVLIRGGTVAGTPRDAEFSERFSAAYPLAAEPPGFREAYDAVYLVALAALAGNSAEPSLIRDHLPYVANPPGEQTAAQPASLPRAVELLDGSEDIDLTGASGLLDFSGSGPSVASKSAVEVWTVINGAYTPLETRDVDLVAEVDVQNPAGQLVRGDGIGGPLKIGAVVSTSGDDAERGTVIANAMQLAVDEINDGGGVGGRTLDLALEDDGGDAAAATEAISKLVADGVAAIIGPTLDDTAVAAARGLGDDSTVPVLTLASAPELSAVENDRLFSVLPLQTVETVVLANIAREAELEAACVIHDGSAAAEAMSGAFSAAFEMKGGRRTTILAVESDDSKGYATAFSGCSGE